MKTFLVLEDEPLIAMDLKFAFTDAGHDAVTAVDNEEALACIEEKTISGAILDVSLGKGKTCNPTADRLLELGLPFVLHTGDLDRVGEHLRNIDAPVIAKPRPADDVVATLLAMVEERNDG
ncbi:response regulator [Erythrobacter sp. LQ02-29]|uniref:response regulator n=1 Tax=Erythrobacter sp. LQ02-29 TaxID=2920384 RepID=UPI001F4E04EC|nr:response regulator [Erythrobacter sp. LQ02-29]MCP9221148.1 response regulator [Erythrobacter sp. LQ02-29]